MTDSAEMFRSTEPQNSSEDHVKQVSTFIRSHVPAARLEQNTLQELTFVLPDNSVKRGGFEIFFSDLEKKQSELGIDSFGLADTALEEVSERGGETFKHLLEVMLQLSNSFCQVDDYANYGSFFVKELEKLLFNEEITASCQANMSPKHSRYSPL